MTESKFHIIKYFERPLLQRKITSDCVQINVSNSCNLNCTYCYRDKHNNEKMSIETFRKVLDWTINEYYPHAKQYVFSLSMSSESSVDLPILKQFNEEIEKYKKEHNIKVPLILWYMTNGTNITEEFLNFFKLHDKPWPTLWISIDGDEQANKDRVGTNYSKLLQNIKTCIDNGINLKASVTLMPEHQNILSTLEYLEGLGFSEYQFAPVRGDFYNNENIESLLSEFDKVYDKLKEMALQKDFRYFKALKGDSLITPLQLLLQKSKVIKPCILSPVVDMNGEVYPCLYLKDSQFSFGNVKNKAKVKEFNSFRVREDCKKCWARYLCGGTCYAENYLKNGDVYKTNEVSCKIRKHKIEKCVELFLFLKQNNLLKQLIF